MADWLEGRVGFNTNSFYVSSFTVSAVVGVENQLTAAISPPSPCATVVKVSIVGSLRDREVACSASDRQGSNFESCVWRTVSSHSSHHPQEVLLAQFSLYVRKGGLMPDSFNFLPPSLLLGKQS